MADSNILERWEISPEYLTDVIDSNPSLRGMISGYIAEQKLKELFEQHKRTDAHRKDDDHDRNQKGDLVVEYKGREFRIEVKSLQTNQIEMLMPNGDWLPIMKKKKVGRKPSKGFTNAGKPRAGQIIYKHVPDERCLAVSESFKEQTQYRGYFQCDASDRRIVQLDDGDSVSTTLLKVGEFDIVAAGLYGFRGNWEFGFALNSELPRTNYSGYTESQQKQLIASLVPVTLPLTAPFVSDPFILLDRLLTETN